MKDELRSIKRASITREELRAAANAMAECCGFIPAPGAGDILEAAKHNPRTAEWVRSAKKIVLAAKRAKLGAKP